MVFIPNVNVSNASSHICKVSTVYNVCTKTGNLITDIAVNILQSKLNMHQDMFSMLNSLNASSNHNKDLGSIEW